MRNRMFSLLAIAVMFSLVVGCSSTAPPPYDADGMLRATGSGAPPRGKPAGQARLMAKRAAVTDARRNLYETALGVQIDSSTTVRDFVTENDTIRTRLTGHL